MREEREPYVIPKNVQTRLTLFGLDVRGWFTVGGALLLAFAELFIHPAKHLNPWMIRIFIAFMLVAIPYIFSTNGSFTEQFSLYMKHNRNTKVLKWESDPYAILNDIIQKGPSGGSASETQE